MRARFVLPVGLLLLSYTSLPGQTRLSPIATDGRQLKLVPLASVTIPAMSLNGDLAGVRINLGFDMVWIGGGGFVELRALPGPGPYPSATTIAVSAQAPLPAGNYSVRWDFVNVGFASQMGIRSANAPLTTCSLNAWPGYYNVQSCTASISTPDGHLDLSITPTT